QTQSVSPVDLKPRPLGQPRTNAVADRAAEGSGSAATALWNNTFVRTAMSLAIVLSLVLALATVAKKLAKKNGHLAAALGASGPRPAGLLEVLGRYPIARGQTLILLKLDRRVLLIGQTASKLRGGPGSLATLCEITDMESVADILARSQDAEHASISARFQSLLHRFDHTHAPAAEATESELEGRRGVRSNDGDMLELLDERAVVHRFPDLPPVEAAAPAARHAVPFAASGTYGPVRSPNQLAQESVPVESFGSIRERLHALRGEAHR
ncbi:MAG: flagellar biosynthetic protein FliO, partial [Phycisphaerales bacterium]|nr:flagellar biosynthetic protein FliO [Phycisphaerales bacterium]